MRTLQIVNIVCAVTIADQELFTFVLTMPPKKKLKRPDNQGLISNLFKSSTQDKPFNPVSSQTLPTPESDKQPVTNVTESDSTQIVDRVSSSSDIVRLIVLYQYVLLPCLIRSVLIIMLGMIRGHTDTEL